MANVSSVEENQFPPDFFYDLDKEKPIPLYFQLAQRIERAIDSGELAPGASIEKETSLGERLGLSRTTVRRAMQELTQKGLLVRRRGIGTVVARTPGIRNMKLTSLFDDLSKDGREPSTQLLARRLVEVTPEVAKMLHCEPGTEYLFLRRLRFSNGKPVALMENYVPTRFNDISDEQLAERGLYQLIRARGARMKSAQQFIGARRPSEHEVELLEMENHDPVLTMDRVSYDPHGEPVEYGHHAYRPDLYTIEVNLFER